MDSSPKNENCVIIYSTSSSSPSTLTFIVLFSYERSQWCPKTFFKISSFVLGNTKKFIQVWNYLRESKWWHNFHFWVNYPFNFERSRALPRAGLAKLSNWWRRALVSVETKKLMVTLVELHDHMWETYRRTNIASTLHQYGLYDGVTRLNPLCS